MISERMKNNVTPKGMSIKIIYLYGFLEKR